MSNPSDGGYNGLKAFGFTVGVTVLIFTILYAARRYNPNLFGQESFSRSYSWYARGPNVPSEIGQGRSLGERPIMWDVWIASWYPPTGSPSERLGVGRGEDEKRDVDGEKKPQWAEFFVSLFTQSIPPSGAHASYFSGLSSHYLRTRYQIQTLPRPRAITPSSPHHLPKSKSTPSSLCPPLFVLPLHLQLPHRTRPTPIARQRNMRSAPPTSHASRETNLLSLGSEVPPVVHLRVALSFSWFNDSACDVDSIRGPLLSFPLGFLIHARGVRPEKTRVPHHNR